MAKVPAHPRNMRIYKKFLVPAVLLASVPAISFAAFDTGTAKADITDAIARLVSKYEARIAELETENASLKAQLAKAGAAVAAPAPSSAMLAPAPLDEDVSKPAAPAKTASATVSTGTSVASTGNAEYDAVIKAVNAQFADILKENGLDASSQLGLFEFVSGKKAFFISIDDWKNPAGVTAFKTKILFNYDANSKTTVAGIFDLNYDVQKYKTLFGSNPYSTAVRIKVKNPAYKGKLLDEVPGSSAAPTTSVTASAPSASTSGTSTATNAVSGDVTAKSVRAAYDKNKLADAIKLANSYLAKNPNDVEILTVRYRSLYITGKYADSLKDVAAIEALQGTKFDCTIAKDAAFIAKSAKDAAAASKYAAIVTACKK